MFRSNFLLGGLTFIFCVALAAEAIQAQSPVTVRAQRVLVQAFTGPAMGGLNDSSAVVDSTCLLYTSPSPRDRQKSRMPSSA